MGRVTASFDVHLHAIALHPAITVAIAIGAVAIIGALVRLLWRRLRTTWRQAKEGAVILTRPRTYLVEVAGVQLASYVARMGMMATLMHAFGIPISIRNIFLIVSASSLSSSVAITPGGVGAQTALTSVALAGVAPAHTIAAYAVGQQLIVTAWNVAFGAVLLIPTVGWQGVRALLARRGPAAEEHVPESAVPRKRG